MHGLQIKMFGTFSISMGDRSISDSDNRSKKVWSLLAYLIFHRDRVLKQSELIKVLWAESEQGVNPSGALKTLFYRARTELDKLWQGAGRDLILCHGDGYYWNEEIPVELDCNHFDRLNDAIAEESEDADKLTAELLHIYDGDFLSHLSAELWIMPISAYYHNVYIAHLLDALPVMIEQGSTDDALRFCRLASDMEPFNEEIHCWYMRAYIEQNKQKEAIAVYQKLSERLLSELGIMPSEELRTLYHAAVKTHNKNALTLEMLQEQLREDGESSGALLCEYDFFRVLHYFMARSVARSGNAVHLVLLSVEGKNDRELAGKKLEKVMQNLAETVCHSLRRGDTAARCSASQFVIMLPRANYENSCMVSERILRSYHQRHSGADLVFRYEVTPLQLDDKENFQWIRERFDN